MQFSGVAAEIDPLEVFFTHSKIRPSFSRGGKRVVDTIQDIEEGLLHVEDLPPVTVLIGSGGHMFGLDNRLLYVLKQLRQKGLIEGNKVVALTKKMPQKDAAKYTPESCSMNCTLMREKEIQEEPSRERSSTEDDESIAMPELIREKNDKKKNKVNTETDEERKLRQKRIIALKQEEFNRQAAERQLRREKEKEILPKKCRGPEHDSSSDSEHSDSDSSDCGESDDGYESEEEVFICDACRKEFKSAQQVEQHFMSKLHKKKVREAKKGKNKDKGRDSETEVRIVVRPKKKRVPQPKKPSNQSNNEIPSQIASIDRVDLSEGTINKSPAEERSVHTAERDDDSNDADHALVETEENSGERMSVDTNNGDNNDDNSNCLDTESVVSTKPQRIIDPIRDAHLLPLIEERLSQLEVELEAEESDPQEDSGDQLTSSASKQSRLVKGLKESRDIIADLEQRNQNAERNQQLVKSFQLEGVGSKAIPSQYVHKESPAFDARMSENRHHTGSHYVMAGGVQFQRGVRVKGVVSRHSRQAAIRNGPVGGGAQNMKRMGLLNEQRETRGKKKSSSGGGKKKSKKNPVSVA